MKVKLNKIPFQTNTIALFLVKLIQTPLLTNIVYKTIFIRHTIIMN